MFDRSDSRLVAGGEPYKERPNEANRATFRLQPNRSSINRIIDRKTIDKYVNAYFSYRVATRRHSLIRPNNSSVLTKLD